MYAKHMMDGRSRTVKGDGSEKESQVRLSTLTDTRPPCFEVLGASTHYLTSSMELGHSGPSGSGGQDRAEITANTEV